MKFYIASGLQNKEVVRDVANQLKEKGHIHTYDWTKNEHISTIEELREIGQKEKEAVLEADTVIVLLPGGKGTHIELGLALGQEKRSTFIHQLQISINLMQQALFIIYQK